MNGVRVSVQANRKCSEDRRAVGLRLAVQRFFHMFETGLKADAVAGEERSLSGTACQSLECCQPMGCSKLANRVHPGVKIER